MELRELGRPDATAVATLFARSRAAAMPWLPILHTPDEDVAYFTDQLGTSTAVGAVDRDAALLGFAIASPGWLDHLYVDPGHLRAGIGTALLAAARQCVPGELSLWVFARNAAGLAFYARHGAVEIERTEGSGNEERQPDVRLLLRLDQASA